MAEAVPNSCSRIHSDPRLRNQRKRKRLNAVLDKISNHISAKTNSLPNKTTYASSNGDAQVVNNNDDKQLLSDKQTRDDKSSMFGGPEQNLEKDGKKDTVGPGLPKVNKNREASPPELLSTRMSKVSFRHDLWQDHSDLKQQQQQQETVQELHKSFLNTVGSHHPTQNLSLPGAGFFKFDSLDRDRYPTRDHQAKAGQFYCGGGAVGCAGQDGEAGEFSPASGRSPHSSLSSPQVSMDSPRICFSPLKIKEEEDDSARNMQR